MAYKHEGFWRSMDTLRDRQMLEDMVEKGEMPWRAGELPQAAADRGRSPTMKALAARPARRTPLGPLPRRAFRRHRDRRRRHASWAGSRRAYALDVHWCVLSAAGQRAAEARSVGRGVPRPARHARRSSSRQFRDGFFPYQGGELKDWVEGLKSRVRPDVILTHRRDDAHQDHREVCELTWNTFRDHLILEYEIPKWDGDLGQPNVYVPLDGRSAGAQDRAAARAFRHAALQGLVRRRDVPRPGAPARHGMPRAAAMPRPSFVRKALLG